MSKFFIQSGYEGKEVSAIVFNHNKEDLRYSKIHEYAGETPVGSVEFVEGILGYSPRSRAALSPVRAAPNHEDAS